MGRMTREEQRLRLLKPLERELADGGHDRVVAGGLERLVQNLGQPFPEVRRLLAGYRTMEPETRLTRLQQAIQLLGGPPPLRPSFDTPLEALGLGPGSRRKLAALGLRSLRDLLHYYPRRYEDRRLLRSVREVEDGAKATVVGRVLSRELVKTPKKGMQLVQVRFVDAWGWRFTGVWFNQPWVFKQVAEGASLVLTGRVQKRGGAISMNVEYFEDEGGESLSTGRIVPVYAAKEGVGQAFLRRAVWQALASLPQLPDPLAAYAPAQGLPSLDFALRQAHFPESEEALQKALHRLKFDEYLLLELKVMLESGGSALLGRSFRVSPGMLERFRAALPFPLTRAQERVLAEVLADMQSERQMARLVQGDVGSGKTVVAAAALYVAAENGVQGALMAPTEILAKQHFDSLTRYLYPLGVRLDLLVGSMGQGEKKAVLERLRSGETQVVVGTHALIQEGVEFFDLGLAVIDEEHRFGVLQRRRLLGQRPDVLVMSATPIPRSLALTLYGDLEISQIDELPPGRQPVRTRILGQKSRLQAYAFARQEVRKGHQVFVVTPMIEEGEAALELAAATRLREELERLLPEVRIDLLHGRMRPEEKDQVMERFRRGEFDLLVSTTVIEVGVDIPRATLMIVENAERFGLAQLHQLRGRVGRGGLEAYCILIAGEASKRTLERLRVLESSNDGFYIAEQDLKLRGPGELRGLRQSGMPDLKLGDLASDQAIIEQSRALAQAILAADPYLSDPKHALLKREIQARAEAIGFREVI
ncbi:ATP-dependent DNA helicase RecG [Meiothermus sp. QL-1]|uniref:ATP-dependent DNA helicase RecG n=1 Tax=Meiothermus sp. QL-1 TaxID=2058095 RepID=UPI000E0C8A0F|nr:ATP-dependent DNA helicase RecG [Meiothermus sp. QL-1]RDI95750.1 ATP-dependent DNA helicase RecG [Meiothermus sp. QL-1]